MEVAHLRVLFSHQAAVGEVARPRAVGQQSHHGKAGRAEYLPVVSGRPDNPIRFSHSNRHTKREGVTVRAKGKGASGKAKELVRALGLEPRTYGLKVRCST